MVFKFRKCIGLALATFASLSVTAGWLEKGELGLPYFPQEEPVVVNRQHANQVLTLSDAYGRKVWTLGEQSPLRDNRLQLPAGYYEIRASDVPDMVERFLVGHPRKNIPSVVGLDAHLAETMGGPGKQFEESLPRQLHAALYTGAWYLRDRFRWGRFEPEKGNWNDGGFAKYYQPQIDAGFHLMLAVEGNSSWSAHKRSEPHNLGHPDEQAWVDLFDRLTGITTDKPVLWQVWNEPNPIGIAGARYPGGINPQKYVDHFLKPAHRGAGSGERLVIGGSAGMDLPWQEGIINAGALAYADSFDLHPYAVSPRQFEVQMKKVLELLDREHFTGVIFGSEFHARTPEIAAQMFVAWFAMDDRMRKGSLMYFDLQDWGVGSSVQRPLTMGVIRTDFSPKPMMAMMNIAAYRLAGATYLRPLETSDTISAHLIKDSEGNMFATVYAHEDFQFPTFLTESQEVMRTDAAGGAAQPLKTLNGMLVVPFHKDGFAYLDGVVDPVRTQNFLDVGEITQLRGQGKALAKMPLVFRNPTQKPMRLELSVAASSEDRVSAELSHNVITLAPGGQMSCEVTFLAAQDAVAVGSYAVTLRVSDAASGFMNEFPLSVLIDPGYSFGIDLLRDASGDLGVLGISVDKAVPVTDVVIRQSDGVVVPFIGRDGSRWDFRAGNTGARESKEMDISLELQVGGAVSYLYQSKVNLLNSVESRLDQGLNADIGLNQYLAQPFKATGSTVSAISLAFNNWSKQSRPITVSIRRGGADGEVLARSTAVSVPGGEGWLMFDFPLIGNIQVGETLWIVNETTYPDTQLRWRARNPYRERAANTLKSFEGAAWSPLTPDSIRGLGLSHRIFR